MKKTVEMNASRTPAPRRAYNAPELVRIGDASELVQGGGGGMGYDYYYRYFLDDQGF